jgi:hypothetical protein
MQRHRSFPSCKVCTAFFHSVVHGLVNSEKCLFSNFVIVCRFSKLVIALGVEKFLEGRPYLLYFGKGKPEDGSPHRILLVQEADAHRADVLKMVRELTAAIPLQPQGRGQTLLEPMKYS